MQIVKLNLVDLVSKVNEIFKSRTNDPIAEMRATGKALIEIADALEGLTGPQAVAVVAAVSSLQGLETIRLG